jgi:non-heme chloroperoxidase
MLAIDTEVRSEVLDWGGTGRTVVLLAGLGNTAHVFDDFAPKLAADDHPPWVEF